jgi:hypothetical protein
MQLAQSVRPLLDPPLHQLLRPLLLRPLLLDQPLLLDPLLLDPLLLLLLRPLLLDLRAWSTRSSKASSVTCC